MSTDQPTPISYQRILNQLFSLIQYPLPHHWLSRLMHWITRIEWKPFKNLLINAATHLYAIELEEAKKTSPDDYSNFNAFFTRELTPDARPLPKEKDAVISPVDGTVSQIGVIEEGRIFQAKGHHYSLNELIGGDSKWTAALKSGSFATIYLSPGNYHRIHMPVDATMKKLVHVPGRLFSVNSATADHVPNLFGRNERVVALFDSEFGPIAVVMVGALFVGSMDTVWTGTVTPSHRRVTRWEYGPKSRAGLKLKRGAEMGRFNMGSTVILLFGKNAVVWKESIASGERVKMGQSIAAPL